ncbi:uncharacterized protein BO95DRAFT_443805, partial [Aspergillus brunneoviolaceus CBS 621.78]
MTTTEDNPWTEDEDCLYLNVWTPRGSNATDLEVMVWIYGVSSKPPTLYSCLLYPSQFLNANPGESGLGHIIRPIHRGHRPCRPWKHHRRELQLSF